MFAGNGKSRSSAQVRHLNLFQKGSVTEFLKIPGLTGLHGGTANIIQQSMAAHGETRLSDAQKGRVSRSMMGATHGDYMRDLTRLAS